MCVIRPYQPEPIGFWSSHGDERNNVQSTMSPLLGETVLSENPKIVVYFNNVVIDTIDFTVYKGRFAHRAVNIIKSQKLTLHCSTNHSKIVDYFCTIKFEDVNYFVTSEFTPLAADVFYTNQLMLSDYISVIEYLTRQAVFSFDGLWVFEWGGEIKTLVWDTEAESLIRPIFYIYRLLIDVREQSNAPLPLLGDLVRRIENRLLDRVDQVRAHPFFWSPAKCLTYILDVQKVVEYMNFVKEYSLAKLVSPISNMYGEWQNFLAPSILERLPVTQGKGVLGLVKCIRNLSVHITDIQLIAIFGEDFATFWISRFPSLVLHLYTIFGSLYINHGKDPV